MTTACVTDGCAAFARCRRPGCGRLASTIERRTDAATGRCGVRTNADKQRAVIAALKHPKGAGKADSKIAEHVGCWALKDTAKMPEPIDGHAGEARELFNG